MAIVRKYNTDYNGLPFIGDYTIDVDQLTDEDFSGMSNQDAVDVYKSLCDKHGKEKVNRILGVQ
jgi:hypothetical protein